MQLNDPSLLKQHAYLDGAWQDGAHHIEVTNPADGSFLANVPDLGALEARAAIDAAARAWPAWRALTGKARAAVLRRWFDLIVANTDDLAVLMTLEQGKPLAAAKMEVSCAPRMIRYFAGPAFAPEVVEDTGSRRVGVHRRPLGVVAGIVPWNFPFLIVSQKLPFALAAGCATVVKPSELTSGSTLLLGDILMEAGLPAGVVNILVGAGPEVGAPMAAHRDVDMVSFTGSTAVGREIGRAVAGTDKGLTLELGGKAANIVFDDAPIDQAIEGVVNGIFFNQGEVCCAGSRLLVQESIAEPFVDRLKERLSTLRVGDPMDKNTDVGAINNPAQLARIEELIEAGVAEGAELYQPACELPARGWFVRPTLFTNVSQSMRIAREEIFGPVLSVITFRTPEEAIEKANNTPYGLSAGVWTEKGSRILNVVSRLRAGVVWANTFNRFDPTSPFGGYKESGFGREGGVHGLLPYLDLG